MIQVPGFETLERGRHTVLIRPEWKPCLLEDLLSDFDRVEPARRRWYSHGRVAHFSYLPAGAPGRLFVRRGTRSGLLGKLLGGLYADLSRPVAEVRAATVARNSGVGVPEPVAVRVSRVAGPFCRFLMISREVDSAEDLLTVASTTTLQRKRELIDRVADEIRALHKSGVFHSDLTLKNILVSGTAIYVIDLDKAIIASPGTERLALGNLSRLNRSVVKLLGSRGAVTRTDKIRFLRRYLGSCERIKEFSRLSAQGLWVHRLWWTLSGQG